VSVAVSPQVCTWCVGDMRPVDGAPAVMVCVFCGRAVSFHREVQPAPLLPLPRLAPGTLPRATTPFGDNRPRRVA